jgi:hypothetical protein
MIGTDTDWPHLGARLLSTKMATLSDHGHQEESMLGILGHPKTIIDMIIIT